MHRSNPDEICALCDEFTLREADPERAAAGQGLCLVAELGRPARYVGWDEHKCVSFRLDRAQLPARRQYVAAQRREHVTTEGDTH